MAGTTWLKIIGSMNSPSSADAGEPLRGNTTKDMLQHVTAGLLIGQSDCGWGGALWLAKGGEAMPRKQLWVALPPPLRTEVVGAQRQGDCLIPPKSPLVQGPHFEV